MADVSSYPKPQAPQNPVAVYGQLLQAQALGNQNKLFQQEFADKAAMNEAYKYAIDPHTGAIDMGKLAANLAGGGMGRLLPQAQQNLQEFERRNLEIQEKKGAITKQKLELVGSQLAGLLSRPDFTRKDAAMTAAKIVALGGIPAGEAAAILSGLAEGGPELRQQVTEIMINNLASQERFKALTPNVSLVDTGGAIKPTDINPLTNPGIVGQNIQKSLSPGDLAATVPGMIGNQPVNMTKAGQLSMGGVVPSAPALDRFGLPPELSTQLVDFYDPVSKAVIQIPRVQALAQIMGATQPMGGAPGAGGVPSTPGAMPRPGGLMKTPPLGAPEAAGVAATASAQAERDALQYTSTAPTRIFQLEQAAKALANPNVETGPGSDVVNTIKSFALNYGGSNLKGMAETVKDRDSAEKYLTQFAANEAGALGPGTDAKLAVTITGNPNMNISKLATQELINATIGIQRLNQAVGLAWTATNKPPEEFNKWKGSFVKDLDPRVFVIDKLPENRREELRQSVAKMSKSDQEKFAKSYNLAVTAGIIPNLYGGQ